MDVDGKTFGDYVYTSSTVIFNTKNERVMLKLFQIGTQLLTIRRF